MHPARNKTLYCELIDVPHNGNTPPPEMELLICTRCIDQVNTTMHTHTHKKCREAQQSGDERALRLHDRLAHLKYTHARTHMKHPFPPRPGTRHSASYRCDLCVASRGCCSACTSKSVRLLMTVARRDVYTIHTQTLHCRLHTCKELNAVYVCVRAGAC